VGVLSILAKVKKRSNCCYCVSLLQIRKQTHFVGLKRATTTPPPAHAAWGEGWCFFLCSPDDLRNKNVNYTHIIIRSYLKMTLLGKPLKKNKFAEILCEDFIILKRKKYFAKPSRNYFRSTKDLLIHKQ
jgi:hypothetical protein